MQASSQKIFNFVSKSSSKQKKEKVYSICSVKISFLRKTLRNIKLETMFHARFEIPAGLFLKAKNSVICAEFPTGLILNGVTLCPAAGHLKLKF